MAPLARPVLEALLRARQLDRTLTTALPPVNGRDELASAAIGLSLLDARLGGGFPRGELSALVGAASSGRTSVMLRSLAAATDRGELVALIDALDRLDVESAVAAGVHFDRLLWVRGFVSTNPGLCPDMNQRALEQAVKALTLVLQAGNFGLVVFDAADAPRDALRRLPFTTWLRLQRMVEGTQTACVLVGSEPMGRSAAGLTVELSSRDPVFAVRGNLMTERRIDVHVAHVRSRISDQPSVPLPAIAAEWGGVTPVFQAVNSDVRLSLSTAVR
jgi:hypothetical protein